MDVQHLSLNEAKAFLSDILQIPYNENPDKLEQLSQITRQFTETIPFQNITLMSSPTKDIQPLDQVVNCLLKGYGGICYDLNVFMYLLLKALDYDAHLMLGSVCSPNTNDHALVLVRNVQNPGDKWLVDVGFGQPTFKPISMDFDKESPVFTECYATYKYVKHDTGYLRMQKDSEVVQYPIQEGDWGHAYYFQLEPVELKVLTNSIDTVIYKGTQDWNWFHRTPTIYGYREGKAVVFRREYFLKENEDGKMQRVDIEGDVAAVVSQEFPMIPRDQVKTAIDKYKQIRAEFLAKKVKNKSDT